GMAGLGEEPPGGWDILLVELATLGRQLSERDGPFRRGRGHRHVGGALAESVRARLEELPPVARAPHGPAHANILEGLLVQLDRRVAAGEPDVLRRLKAGLAGPGDVEIGAPDDLLVLGAEVVLSRQPTGEAGRRVGVDGEIYPV